MALNRLSKFMVILIKSSGNHSNRLFQTLHFEAFCKEHNIEYINPSFANMHRYYENPCKLSKTLIDFLLKSKIVVKISKKLNLLQNTISFDGKALEQKANENIKQLSHSMKQNKRHYVDGFRFRVPELTAKYQDFFIQKYALKEEYWKDNPLLQAMINERSKSNVIVGVHIRRGDYITWQDGRCYFDDGVYHSYMENVRNEIKKKLNKKCTFFIFSNEKINFQENCSQYISINNEWYIDQFLLSKCDYIIGPQSTFSLWASYMGKNKYFQIQDDSGKIHLEDFRCCTGRSY